VPRDIAMFQAKEYDTKEIEADNLPHELTKSVVGAESEGNQMRLMQARWS
jgi:hypothetical protein